MRLRQELVGVVSAEGRARGGDSGRSGGSESVSSAIGTESGELRSADVPESRHLSESDGVGAISNVADGLGVGLENLAGLVVHDVEGVGDNTICTSVGVARARDLVVGVSLDAQTVLSSTAGDIHEVILLIARIAHRADHLGHSTLGDHAVILTRASIIVEGAVEGVNVCTSRSVLLTGDEVDIVALAGLIGSRERVIRIISDHCAVGRNHVAIPHNAVLKLHNVELVGCGSVLDVAAISIAQGVLQSVIVSELDFAGNAVDIALNDPRTVGQGVSALLTVEVEQARDLGGRGSADDVNVISNVVAVQVNVVNLSRNIVVDVGEAGDGLEGIGLAVVPAPERTRNTVLALTTRVLGAV